MTKQHILTEIKRTAVGKRALGRDRFFQETGIKSADWEGKYWIRWSDAVREAGFAPNEMSAAYDNAYLLDKLVVLIRELRHFPVKAEFQLKTRSDPSFPNQKTFSRFGSKTQIAACVADYSRARTGYDDVIAACDAIRPVNAKEQKLELSGNSETFGFVYLFKSGRHFKLGRSNSVGRREYELKLQLPEKPVKVHEIRTDDPLGIETYWHNRFAPKRRGGEWFDLTTADVRAFKRRTFM
jgi:hypothetical protein